MRFLPIFLAFAFISVNAAECPFQVLLVNGETDIHPCALKIAGKFESGKEYSFELEEAVLDRNGSANMSDGGYWGADGDYPWICIEKLSLTQDSRELQIPRKSFTDIGNVSRVEVFENGLFIFIEVAGGDAAGSFHATYTIQNDSLIERLVRASEAPEQVWEKSIFHHSL